ncbi:hypothetical protein GJ496_011669 [Pomphorhynchus laevis]|nr:hypothetical protein GJ496_011669 [Pomphorhynchus laevis]
MSKSFEKDMKSSVWPGGILICFAGVFFSYMLFGIFQESLMKVPVSDGKYFQETTCLVLFQSIFNCVVARIVLYSKQSNSKIHVDTIRSSDYALCAFMYMSAMATSNSALKYVGYPLQVLGKSAKPVSVMLMGIVFARKRYPLYRYACVFLIVSGVAIFMHGQTKASDSSNQTSSTFGQILILCSLTFDGLTGAIQDKMLADHKVSAYNLMFQINLWASLWSWIGAIATGEISRFIDFVIAYPLILLKMLLLSACGALGQIFVFLTVEWFGPLACSVITTTRKFFTIFLSVIIFRHPLSLTQWFGAVSVFTVAIVPELLYRIEENVTRSNYSRYKSNISEIEYILLKERPMRMQNQNARAGILFSSKAFVQMCTNPLSGVLVNRIGYSIPLLAGNIMMGVSALVFSYGESYQALLCARSIQGIGSSCSSVAGLCMLATYFTDDSDRGKHMGMALGGLAMGVLVGPPFGGLVTEYMGRQVPFILLSLISLFNGLIQIISLDLSVKSERASKSPPLFTLLKDPHILVAFGALAIGNTGIAMLEPSLPMWLISKFNATEGQQGGSFLPASLTYLIATNFFGAIAYRLQRWRCCTVGLWIGGLSIFAVKFLFLLQGICQHLHWASRVFAEVTNTAEIVSFRFRLINKLNIPFATSMKHLIIPIGLLGISMGMIDAAMTPIFGQIMDIKYPSSYGNAYAIGDMALCTGYVIGPAIGGHIVKYYGLQVMLTSVALICIMYSPLLLSLRNLQLLEFKPLLLDTA